MADPRAFISFDFDNDATQRTLFVGQAKNSRTPFNIQDWSSKEVLPQAQWEKLLSEKIAKCNMLIVLAGKKTASATGVVKEIAMAGKENVPVFGVYVDGAGTLTPLPTGLQRNQIIVWDWDKISSAVDRMMTEGKNKPA